MSTLKLNREIFKLLESPVELLKFDDGLDLYKKQIADNQQKYLSEVQKEISENIFEMFLTYANRIIPEYQINPKNIDVLKSILYHLFCPEVSSLDKTKGIYLYGKAGSGKTALFKILQCLNQKIIQYYFEKPGIQTKSSFKPFTILNFQELGNDYSEYGHTEIGERLYKAGRPIYIDDLTEPSHFKYFGIDDEIHSIVILNLYNQIELNKAHRKPLLNLTSNLGPGQIKEIYNFRISDRLTEMVNYVYWYSDKSFRQ